MIYWKYMDYELSHLYLRWAVIILIGTLGINVVGLALLSSRLNSVQKAIIARSSSEQSATPSAVLAATADSSALHVELSAIKDELARLRAEQRDINRILALPMSPAEIVDIISTYTTSTGSATKL